MSHDIYPDSDLEDIEDYVRSFIYEDADGSQRLNRSAMQKWLLEQFRYTTGAGSVISPVSKSYDAANITNQLAMQVNRENWAGHPNYPTVSTNNSTQSAKQRLKEIYQKLFLEVEALETPYKEFRAGFAARLKNIYNTVIAPSFPVCSPVTETTQLYVETFVTDRGEESQPSLPSELVTLDENDTVTVTCSVPPIGRYVTHRRLYRSSTGTSASAFRLQGEYPIATTEITDSKKAKELTDICPTFGWLEPPAELQGMTGMANGMMIGFVDRTLYACEPYHPYAWPAKYDKPLSHQIVAIVSMGQSAFVATKGRPYVISGSDAASLSEDIISSKVKCMSAQSLVGIKNSAFYASESGIALYENGAVNVVTEGIIDRKKWSEYNPESMRAAEFDGRYYLFFTREDESPGCLVFDYKNRTLSEMDQAADAVFADDTGLYAVIDDEFYNLLPADGEPRTGHFYSKTFRMGSPKSFGWLQVDSDGLSADEEAPIEAVIRTYGDGELIYTATINSSKAVRHPPGEYTDWRIEIECPAVINGVLLATKTEELKELP